MGRQVSPYAPARQTLDPRWAGDGVAWEGFLGSRLTGGFSSAACVGGRMERIANITSLTFSFANEQTNAQRNSDLSKSRWVAEKGSIVKSPALCPGPGLSREDLECPALVSSWFLWNKPIPNLDLPAQVYRLSGGARPRPVTLGAGAALGGWGGRPWGSALGQVCLAKPPRVILHWFAGANDTNSAPRKSTWNARS